MDSKMPQVAGCAAMVVPPWVLCGRGLCHARARRRRPLNPKHAASAPRPQPLGTSSDPSGDGSASPSAVAVPALANPPHQMQVCARAPLLADLLSHLLLLLLVQLLRSRLVFGLPRHVRVPGQSATQLPYVSIYRYASPSRPAPSRWSSCRSSWRAATTRGHCCSPRVTTSSITSESGLLCQTHSPYVHVCLTLSLPRCHACCLQCAACMPCANPIPCIRPPGSLSTPRPP